jgi:hypothetical protein
MRKGTRALAVSAAAIIGVLAAPVAAAASGPAVTSVDARAAAGIGGGALPATATWYTGTVSAGASREYHWNNAPAGAVYEVGFSPLGASTAATCQFEVTRRWYVQTSAGSRQFWWTFKNVGSLACGANVMLTDRSANASFALGALNPGQSTTTHWNNLDPSLPVYRIGLSPAGATSTDECAMEVTRTWFARDWFERELWMTVKNTGTIACSTTVLLANMDNDIEIVTPQIAPGGTHSSQWNKANPLTATYWLALNPRTNTFCKLEATRQYYVQRVNSNGTTEREFRFTVKNVGSVTCDGGVLLTKVTA